MMIQHSMQAQKNAWKLQRRDHQLGWWIVQDTPKKNSIDTMITGWQHGHAVHCPQILCHTLPAFASHIEQSLAWVQHIIEGRDILDHLDASPYIERLQAAHFEALMSSQNEGDDQEIEKITFDALNAEGQLIAENLWAKFAWLSLHDRDTSLRCRFSFGFEGYEDVAADPERETLAAQLCTTLFPESDLLIKNKLLQQFMQHISDKESPEFVECIAYFNAPNGGALFHHDVEAGHAGAVYAQLSGTTAWLALSKEQLIQHILSFMQNNPDLSALMTEEQQQQLQHADTKQYDMWLDGDEREALDILLNETPAFIAHLTEAGHGYLLQAGDVILLPQKNTQHCAWHSVIGLGDEISHALSFAIN